MKKRTFNIFGFKYTVSISGVKSWSEQIAHFVIHFLVGSASLMFSLGGALFIEARDGEQGHLEEWKEGFNIFPDFFFRILGAVAGHYAIQLVIGLIYT